MSSLSWISNLDYCLEPSHVRKSSIICTIGPKTNNVEAMNKLRDAGMNIARMNFSHGSYEYHGSVIANVRKSQEVHPGRPVAIALDTKGPEIRTGLMANDTEVPITAGHEMIFTTRDEYKEACTGERYYIDYKNITKVIEVGKIIYVDDGIMSFEVLSIEGDELKVRALNNGRLASKKGVNLPETNVDLPALSEKDKADLKFGVEQGVDMVFASFIRTGKDIKDIREVLGEAGKRIKIIAKIENHQGVRNFDEILRETDGVMVARGDLGIEIPSYRVFIAQKSMITKCNLAGKPVICATQMLESMTTNPRPTRAEVSDVANAILDGADCVMLSGETAKGCYPTEAVDMMSQVTVLAESVVAYDVLFNELRALTSRPTSVAEATCSSAVNAAFEEQAGAILVLTTSGDSARLVAKYRPRVPIITVTRDDMTARQVHLYRGCYPFVYKQDKPSSANASGDIWQQDVENRIQWGIKNAIEQGMLKKGDAVICLQGWRGGLGNTNTMRILYA
ncbi:Pyruvate kinase [Entomophthora muscae]|uniref:Pyruvate kinase n=1 Tax=Entomophthora muscae TaxID=34485 RepID=A0ACC2SL63_9FUNG|nr:Pyruvate kinase [Entomophthora muscae]